MSDYFDKVKTADIRSEEDECSLESMILEDTTDCSFDKLFTDMGMPLRICFFLHQSANNELNDYDVLRRIKNGMLDGISIKTSDVIYFQYTKTPGKYIKYNEEEDLSSFKVMIAIFYAEPFSPEKFKDIVQLIEFTNFVNGRYDCTIDIGYCNKEDNYNRSGFYYDQIESLTNTTKPKNTSSLITALVVGSIPYDMNHTSEVVSLGNVYRKLLRNHWVGLELPAGLDSHISAVASRAEL